LTKKQRIILNFVGKHTDVKPRLLILTIIAFSAVHGSVSAGGLSAGLFNSPKGFGFSIDYIASDNIYNSYNVYADIFGMMDGRYDSPGIKACYLHYNRLAAFNYKDTDCGLFLAPGASTGYVRDMGSDKFGAILTADVALALRLSYQRSIDIELGAVAELGFIARKTGSGTQMNIYNNGLVQALFPTLKILLRF